MRCALRSASSRRVSPQELVGNVKSRGRGSNVRKRVWSARIGRADSELTQMSRICSVLAARSVSDSQVMPPRGPTTRTSTRSMGIARKPPRLSRRLSEPSASRRATVASFHRSVSRRRNRTRSPDVSPNAVSAGSVRPAGRSVAAGCREIGRRAGGISGRSGGSGKGVIDDLLAVGTPGHRHDDRNIDTGLDVGLHRGAHMVRVAEYVDGVDHTIRNC